MTDPTKKTTMRGLKAELKNGSTVTVFQMDNGGAYLEFERNGNCVPIKLSAEAMGAVVCIWTQMTWGAP